MLHRPVKGEVVRKGRLRAVVEWQNRGETCYTSPLNLFAIRKKKTVILLMDPTYGDKVLIDHWTTNGRIWYYTTYFLGALTVLIGAIAAFTFFAM